MAKKQPTVNPRRVLPPTPPTTINRITGTGRPGMTTNPIKSTLLEVEPTPKGVYTEKGRGRKQCVGCGAYITSSYHTCPVCNAPQPYNPRGERKEQPISANVFAIVRATVTFLQSQGNDADKASHYPEHNTQVCRGSRRLVERSSGNREFRSPRVRR